MDDNGIVVATDGSAAATAAVRWAAREARRSGAVLHVVHAYDRDRTTGRFNGDAEFPPMAESVAEQLVADARLAALREAPGLDVRVTAEDGPPAPVVLRHAASARTVVVGSRGRGGFTSLLLGSVGHRVAAHAACPAVVVRGRADAAGGPVVVGADGSPTGSHAVELAFAAAAARGAELVAVRAVAAPAPPWGADLPPLADDLAEREDAERRALEDALARWREKYPQVGVEALVTGHGAARVLVGVSHTAQLVVVGDRGLGVFAGTVLGSVTAQLLHHADCPVLVARA